jgi:hypothetical protein
MPSYSDFLEHYASNCERCQGHKTIREEGALVRCPCQAIATAYYRYDQIPVFPSELKYKEWTDFTGEIKVTTSGKTETVGHLSDFGVTAKQKAMFYCFSSIDPSVVKDRKTNLTILNHLQDGQNVIISGGRNTGKTLLAALINREIALASLYFGKPIDFKWITNAEIIEAARWDNEKQVNHTFLDELADADFLTIDNVEMPYGGHNSPPDMISMGVLFGGRMRDHKPTILICSDDFYKNANDRIYSADIIRLWGSSFFQLTTHHDNLVIELQKGK